MDFVISVFRLANSRGYRVPRMNVEYTERETGQKWWLSCGGTRGYVVRAGNLVEPDLDIQAADSHFMIRRMTSSLLLGGVGLFHATAAGRLLFKDIDGPATWTVQLDDQDSLATPEQPEAIESVYDWCGAICHHNILRRAADDAHLALAHPHEALVFVYRGLEWLKAGLGIEWEDLARDMRVTVSELRELKKTANYDTGVRHATKSGTKLRAEVGNYGSWVCGLIDAINGARARLEPGFHPMTSDKVAAAVIRAVPTVPYE